MSRLRDCPSWPKPRLLAQPPCNRILRDPTATAICRRPPLSPRHILPSFSASPNGAAPPLDREPGRLGGLPSWTLRRVRRHGRIGREQRLSQGRPPRRRPYRSVAPIKGAVWSAPEQRAAHSTPIPTAAPGPAADLARGVASGARCDDPLQRKRQRARRCGRPVGGGRPQPKEGMVVGGPSPLLQEVNPGCRFYETFYRNRFRSAPNESSRREMSALSSYVVDLPPSVICK